MQAVYRLLSLVPWILGLALALGDKRVRNQTDSFFQGGGGGALEAYALLLAPEMIDKTAT